MAMAGESGRCPPSVRPARRCFFFCSGSVETLYNFFLSLLLICVIYNGIHNMSSVQYCNIGLLSI